MERWSDGVGVCDIFVTPCHSEPFGFAQGKLREAECPKDSLRRSDGSMECWSDGVVERVRSSDL